MALTMQGKRARLRAKFSSHAASSTPRAAICMAPNAVTNAAALLSSSRTEVQPWLFSRMFKVLIRGA